MNRTINYQIDKTAAGLRVEQFLKRKGYSSQNISSIKHMPESILVNGVHYYMRQELAEGDSLSVRISETKCSDKIPPVELPLDIVYEDEDIIVLNKPAGMPIHPSLNNYYNTMANALAWYYQEQDKPFIFRCCNRLDRDTSGLTVVAKHLVSAGILFDDRTQGSPQGIPCHCLWTRNARSWHHLCPTRQKTRHHHRAYGGLG